MARPRLVWGIPVPSDRWKALTALAAEDPSVGRLAEGHADAVAILSELDGLLSRPWPWHHHNGSGLRTFGAVGGSGDAPRSGTARDRLSACADTRRLLAGARRDSGPCQGSC